MASSNRHWPSMFKSKPCNPHHQWQPHDLIPSSCNRSSSYSSVGGSEERSPEPKPRWNPKPEQIKILEAIFNSGMVNPPRDEIRRIRAQLQEYGQVGDANVFYWFQNRKSRSKHKLRHLQTSKHHQQTLATAPPISAAPAASSSSSSSDKSSPKTSLTSSSSYFLELTNSPTSSVNQTAFFNDLLAEQFLFPVQQPPQPCFEFSELANVVQPAPEPVVVPCTSLLLSEIMNPIACKKDDQEEMKMKTHLHLNYQNISTTTTIPSSTKTTAVADTSVTSAQAADSCNVPARTMVFINDVAVEIGLGPFNVREAFGDDAVLINSSGQPILTNEWGVTLQSLQHGAFYYLVRTLSPFSL